MNTMMPCRKQSPIDAPETVRIESSSLVQSLGPLLVLAPHPDDESLGCGGMIALARRFGVPVQVLFMTDGTQSHPRSRRFPSAVLRELREAEAYAALAILAVDRSAAVFLRWRDGGGLPTTGSQFFRHAVAQCQNELGRFKPRTIATPWRREPHPDHRATTKLLRAALGNGTTSRRVLEYPIWTWQQGGAPLKDEMRAWRLDIKAVLAQKLAAIRAHRSQTTDLIDDDPTGFRLEADTLAFFARPWELFLEDPA